LPRLDTAAHADPHRFTQPDYWVAEPEVAARLAGRTDRQWLLGWRDICRNSDQRTMIGAIFPLAAIGHTMPLMLSREPALPIACLYACSASFVADYVIRQKIGGTHLSYGYLKQTAIPVPGVFAQQCPWAPESTVADWLLPHVLELTYTAWDLAPFAKDCGYAGPPFVWDEERRSVLRAELDAAFFHLYLGTPEEWNRTASDALKSRLPAPRDAVSHILETFPIVKKKDLESFGNFRTKDTILSIYDDLTTAINTSRP
jgi:hypothetical protein